MKLELNPMGAYIKDGKFNQYDALIDVGVRAALCFKETKDDQLMSPTDIRNSEGADILINRGLKTIYSDHTTPSEHQVITLEITGIPKILCMILNNEKQYSADERSLRYTQVEPNEYITELEKDLYDKWLCKFEQIIWNQYQDFYLKTSKGNEKKARIAIHKIAQENARYMVSVLTPTSISYTVPWIQINKLIVYMQRIIDKPLNDLESMIVPYLKEFINLCIEKNIVITKNSIYEVANTSEIVKNKLYNNFKDIINYQGDESFIYKNNKGIDLSLFADRNEFSAINSENEYGYSFSYNNRESFACLAQEQRHRTINFEMNIPDQFQSYVPLIIRDDEKLVQEWINDISMVNKVYPQGQLVNVNRSGSIKNLIKYVAQERACTRAQLEIERLYIHHLIPTIYDNVNDEIKEKLRPYVKRPRCMYPNYHCPSPCGNPNIDRKI